MLHEILMPRANGRTGPEELRDVVELHKGQVLNEFVDQYGSHRYIIYQPGEGPIAGLQVVARMGQIQPVAANLYVVPAHRLKGLASALMIHAIKHYPGLILSQYRTSDGQAWIDALRRKVTPFQRINDAETNPAPTVEGMEDASELCLRR